MLHLSCCYGTIYKTDYNVRDNIEIGFKQKDVIHLNYEHIQKIKKEKPKNVTQKTQSEISFGMILKGMLIFVIFWLITPLVLVIFCCLTACVLAVHIVKSC